MGLFAFLRQSSLRWTILHPEAVFLTLDRWIQCYHCCYPFWMSGMEQPKLLLCLLQNTAPCIVILLLLTSSCKLKSEFTFHGICYVSNLIHVPGSPETLMVSALMKFLSALHLEMLRREGMLWMLSQNSSTYHQIQ